MKKLTILMAMILVLSGCSTARPVIRTEKTTRLVEQATTGSAVSALTDAGSSTRDSSLGALTMGSSGQPTTTAGTKPDLLISASEKEVTDHEVPQTTPSPTTQPPASLSGNAGKEPDPGAVKPDAVETTSRYNLFDYYPLVPDRLIRMTSDSSGPSRYILQYLYEERGNATAQIKRETETGSDINVIRIADGSVSDLYYSTQTTYRTNIIGWTGYEERTILKEPLQVGNRWDSTGFSFEITTVDEARVLNGETLTVLDVLVTGGENPVRFTYALGLGLVSADVIKIDGTTVNLLTYDGMIEDATDDYVVELFFPSDDGSFIAHPAPVSFRTNDAAKDVITRAYQEVAATHGYRPVLDRGALIQYIYLEEDIARVDLNDAFIHWMDEDPQWESFRVASLVNTIVRYTGASGVILSVNDQRYESAQLKFELTEVLTGDFLDLTLIEP